MSRLAIAVLLAASSTAYAWRSGLYPETWKPGFTDAQGRFLHDFSYAGYHAGEQPVPNVAGPIFDVVAFGADPTGAADSTAAIQHAIDEAGAAGGGVVKLPAGTFRVKPPAGAAYALYIGKSRVVLRGAGPTQTFLFNDEPNMREKRVILVRPDPANHTTWYWNGFDERPLLADAGVSAKLAIDTTGLAAGDWIVVRADPTAAFISEHGMTGAWIAGDIGGPIFYRRIVAVAPNELTLDVPLRYPLRLRDNARVHRIPPHLEEIGVEHLAIGNRQNTRAGTGDQDYTVAGTGAYEMHNSFVIYYTHVVNGWVNDVATYRPSANASNVHVLSNVLRLDGSRFVTVTDCDFRRPQYRGAGGNGYLYVMTGSENLVTKSYAEAGRHNYDFGLMYATGSVVHRSRSKDSRLPSDFHMHLSMANLYDNLTVDNDSIEAINRDCCNHGHSTTQSVIWNTEGLRYPTGQILQQYIVDSAQFGNGYVIGTRGLATKVRIGGGSDTTPIDTSEGVGMGDTLVPASLYEDQRARRLGLDPVAPDGAPTASDAGATGDAGTDDHTQPGGCGCTGGGSPSLFIALLILLRRRRDTVM